MAAALELACEATHTDEPLGASKTGGPNYFCPLLSIVMLQPFSA